ncbi:phosphoinositide-dependent protein kinase I [Aplysia californica]|uniref:3-phosphoinositide-dependent protein kinase 1 n=1 Tax=Aplysia californica TaxID=6500 RepID=Q9BMX6_APLCA|nr:phosphoinositide-dependent protein kinase I [Aplysia californica]AAG60622.1 phosphoinositide-dependent protein kinase I [Aplysia californica]
MDGAEGSVVPLGEDVRTCKGASGQGTSVSESGANGAAGDCATEQAEHSNGLSEKMSNLNSISSSDTPVDNTQEQDSVTGVCRSLSAEPEMEVGTQPVFTDLEGKVGDNVEGSEEYIEDIKETSPSPCESMDSSRPGGDTSRESSECPSSLSYRDNMSSQMSMASYPGDIRNTTPDLPMSMSRESSFAFLREESVVSNSSSNQDKEEFLSARESLESSSSAGSCRSGGNLGIKPGELMNQLVEGPLITLPPAQLSSGSSSAPISSPQAESAAPTPSGQTLSGTHVPQAQGTVEEAQPAPPTHHPTYAEVAHHSVGSNAPRSSATSAGGDQGSTDKSTPSSAPTQAPSSGSTAQSSAATAAANKARVKKTPNDFIFGKVIGEGSYSTVYLAKEVSTQKEFAIKVCDKKHLIRERKTHFVMREKEVLMKLDHPFFIRLAYTFQDPERLYYTLTYARNGELLGYLHKLSAFDVPCTRFYTAEIVLALEYLHSLGIVHRDLKPENILLSEDMHIKITDFGTSKILSSDSKPEVKRKNSFVGTAEYVSPEVLNNQPANFGSDLWGLGCIIYQCLSGSLPFRCGNEYQTFQKIVKAEYDFPEGFHPHAKDLVQKLLVIEPADRLGMADMGDLKRHPFYEGVDWENLPQSTPPKLMPYLPATANNPEFWGQDHRTGFDDQRLAEIITGQGVDGTQSPELEEVVRAPSQVEEDARKEKLAKQRAENPFHQFVEDNLILRQGFVDKRKGLFARKRMLLLTEGPHLYYVDAHNKVLKGEIPWSKELRPEAKNFKIFFVHTPNRTYYLESRHPDAQLWVKKIQEVWKKYYDADS